MGQGRFIYLLLLVVASTAVPISKQHKRIKRDQNSSSNSTISQNVCVLDEKTYENGQDVPSLGPCEKCVCEAPDVVCSMIKCKPNSGCRILQQSGQCCPEYKCDCEYNGIVYNNGERLDKPEDPCQVCYCKGGEIMCTSITCYERDDCQPHYTAGQCCPKYDHCPVETSRASGNSVRSVNASLYSPKREMQPWPLTKPNSLTSVSYEESSASPNIYPQTIRIVEILPTTPGSESKPSEVSVIPRIKTNDHSGSKESEEISKEVSSTESSPEYSLITSEVEHLLETTPETGEVKSEPTTATPSSTLNLLAESVDLKTQPDSYRMATVYPDYYHTEGNNSLEDETTNAWNETEGSGYELLKGGIYEESSTLAPLLSSDQENGTENIYTTTDLPHDVVYGHEQKNENYEELPDKNSDMPTFEAYTATEPSVNDESKSNSSEHDYNSSEYNSTSKEDSSVQLARISNLDSSETSDENINNFNETGSNFNTTDSNFITSSDEDTKNETSSSEESSEEIRKNDSSNENLVVTTSQSEEILTTIEPLTSTMATTVEPLTSTLTTVEPLTSTLATTLEPQMSTMTINDRTSRLASKSGIVVTTEDSDKYSSEGYSEASTQASEIYLVSSTPDENKAETKRAVEAYRNLEAEIPDIDEYHYPSRDETSDNYASSKTDNSFTTPSLISIPPVLNVNSLSYGEMGHQLDNNTNHNASSMAKVGIYHPTKPEFASFVTVVDDKIDVSANKKAPGSSHMLLTPEDLKKLAEILIHQKIKPAHLGMTAGMSEHDSTKNPLIQNMNKTEVYHSNVSVDGENTSNTPNTEEVTLGDGGVKTSGTHDNFDRSLVNEKSSTVGISGESVDSNDGAVTESSETVTNFQDSTKTIAPTVSSSPVLAKEGESDDPNTSRQIRIPEKSNQYSALLDDRDLVILENFFKKNMGLH